MALFSTYAGNIDENQRWLASLPPDARNAWMQYASLDAARQNYLSSKESGGRTTEALAKKTYEQGGGDAAYNAAISNLQQNYPAIWEQGLTRGQRVGGLGQGGNELVALGAGLAGAAGLFGAGGGTAAGTTAGTAGTAGTGTLVGEAAGGTVGLGASGMGTGAGATGAGTTAGIMGSGSTSAGTAGMMGVGGSSAGGGAASGGFINSAGQWIANNPNLVATGLNIGGGLLAAGQQRSAAETSAAAQIEAARIAAEASKFRPVGVTTRFGQSQFGYDAQGNLTSAGYQLTPEMKAQQDALMGISGGMLDQYRGAQAATAPMGAAAQQAMTLGQGYLGTSPQAQAAQYMAEQQGLLAAPREREMAALQARLQAQGRGGLAVGGTSTGMMAANPELEAYYNAKRQQDLALAAQATQGGMDYARFGAGMVGTGGDLLKGMYGAQTAAYSPYQTALGGAAQIEALGQQPMDIGTAIGAKTSTAAAQAGLLTAQGIQGAANTMQPVNAYSPWADVMMGAGQAVGQYGKPAQTTYDPGKFRLEPL